VITLLSLRSSTFHPISHLLPVVNLFLRETGTAIIRVASSRFRHDSARTFQQRREGITMKDPLNAFKHRDVFAASELTVVLGKTLSFYRHSVEGPSLRLLHRRSRTRVRIFIRNAGEFIPVVIVVGELAH